MEFSLLGESSQVLREIAADITPILMRNKSLRDVRVVTLDLAGMVAGTRYRGDYEKRITGVVD